ncbi:MAG: hypothetical protein HYZ63_04140 [Candidatus Andersenbacteria bacterium]|nr:hypothetical protein [Candidatus Andersenbacteria bacterium]
MTCNKSYDLITATNRRFMSGVFILFTAICVFGMVLSLVLSLFPSMRQDNLVYAAALFVATVIFAIVAWVMHFLSLSVGANSRSG